MTLSGLNCFWYELYENKGVLSRYSVWNRPRTHHWKCSSKTSLVLNERTQRFRICCMLCIDFLWKCRQERERMPQLSNSLEAAPSHTQMLILRLLSISLLGTSLWCRYRRVSHRQSLIHLATAHIWYCLVIDGYIFVVHNGQQAYLKESCLTCIFTTARIYFSLLGRRKMSSSRQFW